MKLHCPHCGVKGSADDSYRGRKVKCPKCKGIFEVARDMSVAPSEDAALLAATGSTPVQSSTPPEENASPLVSDGRADRSATDEAPAVSEAEEMLEFDQDPAESDPAKPPSAQEPGTEEELLNWDDIASEIDLQLAEGGPGTEQDEIPEASPEIATAAGNSDEETAEDGVQLVEETDEIELEPYGIDKKPCWQCGKSDSIGESFITRDGRLYCTDCAPIEDSAKTADTNREQEADDAGRESGATDDAKESGSWGTSLKKAWAKLKGALFS